MTLNWRKPVIMATLSMSGSKIPGYLKEIDQVSRMSREEIVRYQEEKLKLLLLHAYRNVPYYHRILAESGVISGGNVRLEHFENIPFLTKDIIRKEGYNLYSSDYLKRKPYENTSGGSTGEPVRFIQDRKYHEWNTATKLSFNKVLGKEIGDREIKFWGSDRDIFEGTIGIRNTLINFLYNRYFINSFRLTPQKLQNTVNEWDKFRPLFVWSYLSSVYELARYLEKNNRTLLYPPKGIIVTAAPLSETMRVYLEKNLGTRIYTQYGSREVGAIACECKKQEGLHIFDFFQYVESIKQEHSQDDILIVTNLRNFSMPLIRYQIGDTANLKIGFCSCGQQSHVIQNITGRVTDHFILEDGTRIGGGCFYHLFLFKPWIKKYQVIQKDYSTILCKIVPEGEPQLSDIRDIEKKIRFLMGDSCNVIFEFVDKIEPSKSGKHRFVICEMEKRVMSDIDSQNY